MEDHHSIDVEFQQNMLGNLSADEDRKILRMYISLTSSEFIYVRELQKAYDETRCYFSQWVISKEIKEMVNSARLTANDERGAEIYLDTSEARNLYQSCGCHSHCPPGDPNPNEKRTEFSSIVDFTDYLETSIARRQRFAIPILLPEIIYLELVLGCLSPQECNTFAVPTLGDDLSLKDRRGKLIWTPARLKVKIDACTQPPPYRGHKSPITDLINRPKLKTNGSPKQPYGKNKGRERKGTSPANDKTDKNDQ